MSEREFENYLTLVCRLLRLGAAEREATSAELRDHLEQRLAELTGRGVSRDEAVALAVAEFGDAAALAAEFSRISRQRKKRWMMRMTVASMAGCVVLILSAMALWPNRQGPGPQVAVAQDEKAENPFGGGEEGESSDLIKDSNREAKKELGWSGSDDMTAERMSKHVKADFVEVPLNEFLFATLDSHKIQHYIDRPALEEAGIGGDEQITINLEVVPMDMLFDLTLRQVGLSYTVREGIVIVTTPEALEVNLETRVYDVRDLPAKLVETRSRGGGSFGGESFGLEDSDGLCQFGGAEGQRMENELIDLITSSIQVATWSDVGGPGTIRLYHGALVISQTQNVHREVKQLLEDLRTTIGKKETRSGRVGRRGMGGMDGGGMGVGSFDEGMFGGNMFGGGRARGRSQGSARGGLREGADHAEEKPAKPEKQKARSNKQPNGGSRGNASGEESKQ